MARRRLPSRRSVGDAVGPSGGTRLLPFHAASWRSSRTRRSRFAARRRRDVSRSENALLNQLCVRSQKESPCSLHGDFLVIGQSTATCRTTAAVLAWSTP